jgi:putative Ca2+/H+ antiporter (TMEM165/GDT1 family)
VSATVALTTALLILPVELPDKTLIATLVLATRYRPLPVLAGVVAAFGVQSLIAVTAGQLLTLLPHRLVAAIVAVLFGIGAVVLLRGGEEPEELVASREALSPAAAAGASFGVLFAAEWGDASQLATAALTARYHDPIGVGTGAFVALVGVAALAIVLGQAVTRRVPLRLVQRAAGLIFVAFAVLAIVEAIRG